MKWIEKWKYHKKQPAVQTIIKYNCLRLLTHILQLAAMISWLAWIAFSIRELLRLVLGRELVDGIQITKGMMTNSLMQLMLLISAFFVITIFIIHPLGKKAIMGVLAAALVPLTMVSFCVSVIGKHWEFMLICGGLYIIYTRLIWLGKRYRTSIQQQTDRTKTHFYVTCSLDEIVAKEKSLFPVSESWEMYISEEVSEMKVSKELFLVKLPKKLQQQETHREIEWTKRYRYKGMSHGFQLTRSIRVLSKEDYLRFVGECLQNGQNIFHVGEHIVGVVLGERPVFPTVERTHQEIER